MVGCVLTGHGEYAKGLNSALEMVGGPQSDFKIVCFLNEQAADYPDILFNTIKELKDKCGEVVVFCDLVGGTPFNQSMMASCEIGDVEVVAGCNLPMLLECVCLRDDKTTAKSLADMAVQVGRMGVDHKVLNVVEDDGFDGEDGI